MKKNTKIAIIAACAPILMFGAAFAGVPLYKLFCEKTGYGGTTTIAKKNADGYSDKVVHVSFDSNVMPDVKWEFKPKQNNLDVKLGQNVLAFYTIKNTSDKPVTAIAEYNVAPHKAAIYFQKLECFCFTNQTLQPGQSLELPVLFFVDKRIAEDATTKDVKDLTLSYTFMLVKPKKDASVEVKTKTKS